MNKWIIYVLGIITGIIITLVFAFCINLSNNSKNSGLELFDTPGEYMDYTQLRVFQVGQSGSALAYAGTEDSYDEIALIIPNEEQRFYDDQKIVLKNDQCFQRVGTFKYRNNMGIESTVPAVRIIDGVDLPETNNNFQAESNSGITLFDEPGECVSRNDFEVQKVLDSGDAIALEITDNLDGYVFTSDLEVLILAQEDSHFYNNQIVKAPQGKCARQIGTYKFQQYGNTKVIPIIAFK